MPKTFFSAIAKLGPAPPQVNQIALGSNHGILRKTDSTIRTWGVNTNGQLGDGSTTNAFSAVTPSGGLSFKFVEASQLMSYGITTTNVGYAWGFGAWGDGGWNSTTSKLTPTAICGGFAWNIIKSNFENNGFAIGLTTTGVAYGWGNGLEGKLGINSTTAASTPVPVCGGHTFCKLDVGGTHTVAINSVGQAYAWGNGGGGKLGNNAATNRSTPVAVCGGFNFCEVAAGTGNSHALTSNGVMYSWGGNGQGSLGNNSTLGVLTPVAVCGGHTFCKISAALQTCFAINNLGTLYSWGLNQQGVLGLASTVTTFAVCTPRAVCGGYTFCDITINGNAAALAVTNTGQVYGWGNMVGITVPSNVQSPVSFVISGPFSYIGRGFTRDFFQMDQNGIPYSTGLNTTFIRGNGTAVNSLISYPTCIIGGQSFTMIDGGTGHACGLNHSKLAYCWGSSAAGQIGDRASVSRSTPVAVCGGQSFNVIVCGTNNSYGINTSGVAYAWGTGSSGAIGDNTIGVKSTPVAVCGGQNFCRISAGTNFACAINSTGAAYCWGAATNGTLGDNTIISKSTPVLVTGGLTFCQISSNQNCTMALTNTGLAYGWGSNNVGQLGIGAMTGTRSTPTAVCGGLTFCKISAGTGHGCAVTNLGVAYCWGQGGSGQLGNNTLTNSCSPVAVCGGHTFCDIKVGDVGTIGLTNLGGIYVWGLNSNYELGLTNADVTTPTLITYL